MRLYSPSYSENYSITQLHKVRHVSYLANAYNFT